MAEVDPRVTFFPKRKLRLQLVGWSPKMNSEGEKRIRLDFMLPLVDEARSGVIPGWIIDDLNAMEKAESKTKVSSFDVALEGVTLEFWDTPKSLGRSLLLTATSLGDFKLSRITVDKNTSCSLLFNTNVKRSSDVLHWADRYEDCWLWAEATPSAPDLPSKPVPGEQMTIADTAPPAGDEQSEDEQAAADSQANISEFFHVEGSDGEDEAGDETEQDGFGVEGVDDEEDEVSSDGMPVQSPEAAEAVAEIPEGHEECIHCHNHFPRSQEPANWVEGKVRKSSKAPLAVRKVLGTSFGCICGGCVNELTPKPEHHDEEVATRMVN